MKKFHPSPSFEILLPDHIAQQKDDRVSSFWINEEPLLLQLSSYVKKDGSPIAAKQRLDERMIKFPGQWSVWEDITITPEGAELAIAEIFDENELLWVHAYVDWPHLTIYSTISGPEHLVRNSDNWALSGLRNIRLTVP